MQNQMLRQLKRGLRADCQREAADRAVFDDVFVRGMAISAAVDSTLADYHFREKLVCYQRFTSSFCVIEASYVHLLKSPPTTTELHAGFLALRVNTKTLSPAEGH
jgi:hypothetical protein